MSVRELAKDYLEKKFGEVPEFFHASKYYTAGESWTGSPAWWFDVSLNRIEDETCKEIHLLCQKENRIDFCCLKVPTHFFREKLDLLKVIPNRGKIRLHLSARQRDIFCDIRGAGRINFSQWLQKDI
jgi:hypothetical protein